MARFRYIIKTALRAAIWKTTPQACAVGVPALLCWSLVAMAAGIAYEYAMAGAAPWFNAYGLNSAIAQTAVSLAVASLFVSSQSRATFLSALLAFDLLWWAIQFLALRLSTHWPFALPNDLQRLREYLQTVMFVVELVWWVGALYAIMRSIIPTGRGRPLLRAMALWPALLVASLALPYYPTFRGPDFDNHRVNLWEYVRRSGMGRSTSTKGRHLGAWTASGSSSPSLPSWKIRSRGSHRIGRGAPTCTP